MSVCDYSGPFHDYHCTDCEAAPVTRVTIEQLRAANDRASLLAFAHDAISIGRADKSALRALEVGSHSRRDGWAR